MTTLARRLITVPAVLVAVPLLVVLAPLLVPLAALVDLVAAPRRRPTLRLYAFAVNYGLLETAGLLLSLGLWLASGFGLGARGRWWGEAHHRVQRWWAGQLRDATRRWLGVHVEVEGAEVARSGPLVVLPRHASFVDALLPAWLLSVDHDLHLRYVMKRDLLLVPCLDVVGSRLPNHFIDRTGGVAEVVAVADLGHGLGGRDTVVLFPEGTFPTPALRARLRERLAHRDPELGELAGRLHHLLPPRPGGAVALLHASDDVGADVLFVAHTGFEAFTPLSRIWWRIPRTEPIRVRLVRVARAEIPTGDTERRHWLLERWVELDAIVGELEARRSPPPRPVRGTISGIDREEIP